MAPRLTPEARRLLARQRGVLAAWQLTEVGMSAKQARLARRQDWQRLTPRTMLTTPAEPTPAQLRFAGALEAGPGAALSGCSALIEAGWKGTDDGHVDVVVARGTLWLPPRRPAWLRVHSTVNVPRSGGVPAHVTSARAAVDACAWARSPRERLFILASIVQQRMATPGQLRRELATRGRVAHAREIRGVLDMIEHGVTSTGEADFLRQCRARGLPAPRMQVRRTAGGRLRRIDAEFRLPDGRVVIVEIDGVGHMEVGQWQADLQRQNELVADSGAIFLHVTTWQLTHDPDPFFDLLRQVIGSSL